MLCAVYKSPRKEGTYLFVERRDDFSAVPAGLLNSFGVPRLVTIINLAAREQLAQADIHKVRQALTEQGFYLQLPPPPEDLLAQHKAGIQQ
ncbi:YcgL domain-containing protein [Chromatiaceae bacterium AAb-1]|nr:YcgL domain-containing protein [Chromatiaceae bacterium AAb-1]